jgi:hypothetical protein
MGKSMKYAGRVVRGVPIFFEYFPFIGRLESTAVSMLERQNTELRMLLEECESGRADNDSQEDSNESR